MYNYGKYTIVPWILRDIEMIESLVLKSFDEGRQLVFKS